jgi:hypothetical protein
MTALARPDQSPDTPDTFVCPWWLIQGLDNPLRRLFHKPDRILSAFVRPGDRCLDIGCGYRKLPRKHQLEPTRIPSEDPVRPV